MRKWLHSLFYVPHYGKVSEKTLISRLSVYISIIVLCLAAMGFSAYAYFSSSITSGSNIIQAAHFDVDIVVTVDQGEKTLQLMQTGTDRYQVTVNTNELYSVTVNATGTTDTGFVVMVADGKTYHTAQLGGEGENTVTQLSFTLKIESPQNVQKTVVFIPHWGTSSSYAQYQENGIDTQLYIQDTESVVMSAKPEKIPNTEPTEEPTQAPTTLPSEQPAEPTVEPTEPETTQPTTTVPPTQAPTEPSTEATEPSTEAIEPTEESTEAATEPSTEETEPTVENTTDPTEPSSEPTEPSTEATEPTEPSSEPTEPSAEATDPTEASAE